MIEASYKFDSRSIILELKGNSMLSEGKKYLSQHSWNRIQHSACGSVTTEKLWIGNHYDLSDNNKRLDALARYLTDVISPVIRYQVSMVKTPAEAITRHNQ